MRLLVLTLLGVLCALPTWATEPVSEDKSRSRQEIRTARQAERSSRRWWQGRRIADSTEQNSTPPVPLASEGTATDKTDPSAKSKQGTACMRFERRAHNFGDVPRKGGDLVYDFPFVNEGTVPLVVTRVITSCSCLKASYPKRPVAPGAKAVIRITYEPHKSEAGVFNKVIQVYSNSSTGRELITVQGNSISGKE